MLCDKAANGFVFLPCVVTGRVPRRVHIISRNNLHIQSRSKSRAKSCNTIDFEPFIGYNICGISYIFLKGIIEK